MSMTGDEYNGWCNYETWCANLWIDNDEGTQNYWAEVARECYDEAEGDDIAPRERRARWALADRMKDEFEESIPEAIEGFHLDMMRSALGRVEWRDIAEHFIDTVLDDIKEEEDLDKDE